MTIREDLEIHPELSPMIDVDTNGNVVCLGWVSQVYDVPQDVLDDLEEKND